MSKSWRYSCSRFGGRGNPPNYGPFPRTKVVTDKMIIHYAIHDAIPQVEHYWFWCWKEPLLLINKKKLIIKGLCSMCTPLQLSWHFSPDERCPFPTPVLNNRWTIPALTITDAHFSHFHSPHSMLREAFFSNWFEAFFFVTELCLSRDHNNVCLILCLLY